MIDSKDYYDYIDETVLRLWNAYYKNYYINAVVDVGAIKENLITKKFSLKELIKIHIKKIFKKDKEFEFNDISNKLLLLHNIRIESHRWTVERALSLLEEKDYNTD